VADRSQSLDYAERWLADAFRVMEGPGGFGAVEVDMTHTRELMERLRERGIRCTYTHIIVRAAAVVLDRHPEIHMIVAGSRRLRPDRVDIGLSVAGSSIAAPVMVIEDAASKRLPDLCEEINRRIPEVRAEESRSLAQLRRWGWLAPTRWLRRIILRVLFSRTRNRRKVAGTFQVSVVSNIDFTVPFLFLTAGALGVGAVRDRVIAVGGRPVVRPTAMLACSIDHKAWDGAACGTFLGELRGMLETEVLDEEVTMPFVRLPEADASS
jgi:pyruvate dehydrogenase E2 component (dihydrolipoamide acetyltransferase)